MIISENVRSDGDYTHVFTYRNTTVSDTKECDAALTLWRNISLCERYKFMTCALSTGNREKIFTGC